MGIILDWFINLLTKLLLRFGFNLEKIDLERSVSEDRQEELTNSPARYFSSTSKKRLLQCDPKLQQLCHAILQDMDISILCGYRGEKEQNEAFANKRTKLKFPQSKHNILPSRAVDIAPYPIDFNDIKRFQKMCLIAEDKANELGIKIRLGRDFSFKDYPHIELI